MITRHLLSIIVNSSPSEIEIWQIMSKSHIFSD